MALGLAALLDDIAALVKATAASLDDIAAGAVKASTKAVAVVVDDTAVTPQYVEGIDPKRELPIIKRIATGSLVNKSVILVLALLLSEFAAWGLTPLLMLGGTYLCFEGAHKIWDRLAGHRAEAAVTQNAQAEDAIVKSAVRTDFILSAEIIAITLGIVAHEPLPTQITVMAIIALTMTVGVYGIVAAIVKLDDLGLYLSQLQGGGMRPLLRAIGRGILRAAPWLMKGLSIAGTIAMFLVGGGIVTHGIPAVHHALEHGLEQVALPAWLSGLALPVAQGVVGLLAGLVLALVGIVLTLVTGNGLFDCIGSGLIGVLLVAVAVLLGHEMQSLLLGESAGPETESRIIGALTSTPGVEGVIHMKTVHTGPDQILLAAKIAVTRSESAEYVAAVIDAAERTVRGVEPRCEYIYLEPDIRRSGYRPTRRRF